MIFPDRVCALSGCRLLLDHNAFKDYKKLWASHGHKTDYTAAFGMPATLINMGVYGLFILLYYNIVQGMAYVDGDIVFTGAKFTGATMGAIMCMYAFVAQGAQPAYRISYPGSAMRWRLSFRSLHVWQALWIHRNGR